MSKNNKNKKYGYFSNFKYIVSEQWKYKKSYFLTVLLLIPSEVLLSLVTAYLPAAVTGCIERRESVADMVLTVGVLSLGIVILTVISRVLEVHKYKLQNYTKNIHYRNLLITKIMDMDYNNYVHNRTRIMRQRATTAATRWLNGVGAFIELNKQIVTNLLGFGAFATVVFRCNPWFVLFLIISYIFTAVSWLLFQKYKDSLKDTESRVKLKLDYVTYKTKDLSGIKDIKLYNFAEVILKKIAEHTEELKKFDTKVNNVRTWVMSGEEIIGAAVSLGAYIYLIKQKLDPAINMSVEDFLWNFTAITGFSAWLVKLVNSVSDGIESCHFVDDFRNFLDIPDTLDRKGQEKLELSEGTPCSIELENVSFTYEKAEKPTIDNVSLKIESGEKIAVVGVNGAGKTTLIKLISGLFLPQSGSIKINGIDSKKFGRDNYYTFFSAVFQETTPLPLSIAENITLCPKDEIDYEHLLSCIKLAGFDEKIKTLKDKEQTNLVKEINEDAVDLSGGEFQKLLLARALYKNSPIILLDEPTASMDPIAERDLYLQYEELTKNKTSIYISHRLASTRFCDRIILLDDSKIAEIGTHDELIKANGKYAEMFNAQSKYYKDGAIE